MQVQAPLQQSTSMLASPDCTLGASSSVAATPLGHSLSQYPPPKPQNLRAHTPKPHHRTRNMQFKLGPWRYHPAPALTCKPTRQLLLQVAALRCCCRQHNHTTTCRPAQKLTVPTCSHPAPLKHPSTTPTNAQQLQLPVQRHESHRTATAASWPETAEASQWPRREYNSK